MVSDVMADLSAKAVLRSFAAMADVNEMKSMELNLMSVDE